MATLSAALCAGDQSRQFARTPLSTTEKVYLTNRLWDRFLERLKRLLHFDAAFNMTWCGVVGVGRDAPARPEAIREGKRGYHCRRNPG